jgi:Antitoxin VbhA
VNGIAPLAQQLGFGGVHRVVASDHPQYEEHNRVLDGCAIERSTTSCTSDAKKPAAQRRESRIKSVTTRVQAAENALASVRAEGLDPGVAEALLGRWARGELSDAQLDDAAHQISTGEPLSELGTEALALSPGSSIMTARGRPA